MRAWIASRRWLRVYQLPSYAPELNPTENIWSNLKRSVANLAPGTITDLAQIAKNRLKACNTNPPSSTGSSPPPDSLHLDHCKHPDPDPRRSVNRGRRTPYSVLTDHLYDTVGPVEGQASSCRHPRCEETNPMCGQPSSCQRSVDTTRPGSNTPGSCVRQGERAIPDRATEIPGWA